MILQDSSLDGYVKGHKTIIIVDKTAVILKAHAKENDVRYAKKLWPDDRKSVLTVFHSLASQSVFFQCAGFNTYITKPKKTYFDTNNKLKWDKTFISGQFFLSFWYLKFTPLACTAGDSGKRPGIMKALKPYVDAHFSEEKIYPYTRESLMSFKKLFRNITYFILPSHVQRNIA